MSVSREEIERVANLASLRVDDEEMKTLPGQISSILDYVAQLAELTEEGSPYRPGPSTAPVRADAVNEGRTVEIAALSKHVQDDLVIVPRIGALDES